MMKKVLVLAAAAFAALHAAGITATKEYVDRKIGETENYADSAVRDASNNLARVIANAAPADYATVSNRAMTALQAHQSLAPSTNYTDAAILAASNNLARVIANATPADYATVSNRAMTALQAHQSLAPSTNYTDSAVRDASNNLARVIANAAPADYATVSNRAMTALQAHQSLAPSTNYTDAAILAASNNIVQSIGPMAAGVTTNDVCAIVTNVVTTFSDWAVFIDGFRQWDWPAVVQYRSVDPGDNAVRAITVRGPSTVACYILESRYDSGLPPFNPNETAITNTIASGDILFSEYNYLVGSQLVLTRTANPRNALGLARLVDVPSNNSQLINGAGYTTTNDVCAIVTNETVAGFTEWVVYTNGVVMQGASVNVYPRQADPDDDWFWFDVLFEEDCLYEYAYSPTELSDAVSVAGAFNEIFLEEHEYLRGLPFVATRERIIPRNALGLARLSDIPTNHVTQAEMQEAIDGIEIPDVSGLATKGEVAAVSNEAQIVYRLFSGSNVVDEVTNYNSQVRLPSRRLYQLDTNGYHMVWNEMDQHTNTLAQAKAYADTLGTNYAPRAWSRTTAMYGAEAPSNTTWISTPTTVIAGGYEYEKFATSGGAIWVLTSRGETYGFSPNTNNTAFLNIAAQDGTPIFRIEKTDSYLLGVNASAIEVENDTMYVDVNIAAASHPFVRVCEHLGDGWQKEEDGISASLATVNWTQTANGYRCEVTNNTGGSSLFAYFEYLQEGGVKIVNGGVLDISGGLIVNGTTYTRIGTATISGHTVLTLEP